jgi:hypothetical protein
MTSSPASCACSVRRWGAALGTAAAVAFAAVPTSAQASADDAAVRAALVACVQAWNRHDPTAFGDCLTEDIWFSESDDSFYKRFQGRAKVLGTLDYNIRNTALRWDVVWVRPQPDGTVAVRLKQQVEVSPSQRFASDPSFARLRREGGAWKPYFFTSHEGWAKALIAALDAPANPAASKTPVTPRIAAMVTGTEPPAYTTQFGSSGLSCFHCHGSVPSVRDDPKRARIIAVSAEAADGAALRRAMAEPRLGGIMRIILGEPTLTDEHLEAIRPWMRAMRDGRADRSGDRVVIHNERSPRDPPVRLARLRAEGGWRLPPNAGCRQGAALAGGKGCQIALPPGSRGALVFQFAASKELQPQEVRVALD